MSPWRGRASLIIGLLVLGVAGCPTREDEGSVDDEPPADDDDSASLCDEAMSWCDGNRFLECEPGVEPTATLCEAPAGACAAELGCVPCVPHTRRCDGARSEVCAPDGSGWELDRDCGSATCSDGFCDDACGRAAWGRDSAGCEYTFSVSDYVYYWDSLAVLALANPGTATANVTVTEPLADSDLQILQILPGETAQVELPDTETRLSPVASNGVESSHWIDRSRFVVRSDAPLSAVLHQRWASDNTLWAFNRVVDSTEMRPTHSRGRTLVLYGDPSSLGPEPTLADVHGTQALSLRLWVGPTREFATGPALPGPSAFNAFEPEVDPFPVEVPDGAVLRLATRNSWAGITEVWWDADPSGTRIDANRPFTAFVGRDSYMQENNVFLGTADAVLAEVPPMETWGRSYVVAPMPQPHGGWRGTAPVRVQLVAGERTVRISGGEDGEVELQPYESTHIEVAHPALLEADGPFLPLVKTPTQALACEPWCQFVPGDARTSDPAYLNVLPTGSWPDDALFEIPPGWRVVHLAVVAREGTVVLLDGEPLELGPAVGDFVWDHVRLDPGLHRVRTLAGEGVGVSIYQHGPSETAAYTTAPRLGPRTAIVAPER